MFPPGISRLLNYSIHDFTKAISALDQLFKTLDEASCRSAVDNVMVDADRDTQVFTDSDLSIHHTWFLRNTAQGDLECMVGNGNPPAAAKPEHPYGRHDYCTVIILDKLWILEKEPIDDPPEESGQQDEPADKLCFASDLVTGLECPDLFVYL